MTPTRKFLLDLAEGLESSRRHEENGHRHITMSDTTAKALAKRARELAGAPTPPLFVMPSPLPPVTAELRIAA